MKKCSKCEYVRKPIEQVSEQECPNCGAYYAKVEAVIQRKQQAVAMQLAEEQAAFRQENVPAPPLQQKEEAPNIHPALRRACNFCGEPTSRLNAKCRHCGQVMHLDLKTAMAGIVAVSIFIMAIYFSDGHIGFTPPTEAEKREERIEKSFNPWDGSHKALTVMIKETMYDPNSYEHAKTVYYEHGNSLIVETTYRGKNAFGAVVKNKVRAECDMDGNVRHIIYQGP